jgi:phosphatidate cytidylyltransferase
LVLLANHVESNESGGILLRLLTAGAAMLVICALAFHEPLHPAFDVIVSLAIAVGMLEFYGLVRAAGIGPESFWGTLGGLWIAASACLGFLNLNVGLLTAALVVATAHLLRGNRNIAGLATSVFGLVYVAWMGGHIILLRSLPDTGVGHIMILFFIVWLNDAGAYGIGKGFGRYRLPATISPNKTLEGCVGGLVYAVLGAAILKEFQVLGATFLPAYSRAEYVLIAFALSAAGQLGDLTESYIKRDAGVKDSGRFFPGHGGLLDRCDGLLFAAPVFYYLAQNLI